MGAGGAGRCCHGCWGPQAAVMPSTPLLFRRGKFGEVHTCTEKQTGLKLAAKVIRKQGAKDKV